MSIQISQLSKNYGKQLVLNNISFEIGEGELVGFLGPNGAGKTSTMRILTGAIPYESGSVKICGMEVKDHQQKTAALIGYLPEHNPLYSEMYVKEYLLFVAGTYKIKKEKKQRVESLIDKVGLRPEAHKKIGELSKGYRQRVGLAQALMPNPRVLILDEPTTGLDPNQLEEIRALIREIGKERTVLLSTHIMQEIKAICNRIIIINQGEIVGDYSDLSEMKTEEASIFRIEVEFLKSTEKNKIECLKDIKELRAQNKKNFIILANSDIRSEIFDFAVESGNKILKLNLIENDLEECFRALTKSKKKTL